jgi:hypothetical protein
MTLNQPRIPTYIVVGRITAVVGMSLGIALGIFLLLGGLWVWGLVSLAASLPFFAMIFLIERAPGGAEAARKSVNEAG